MTKLPTRLQPYWPLLKRVHRLLARALGAVNRLVAPRFGIRGVPRSACDRSVDTAAVEPQSVIVHPGGGSEHIVRTRPTGLPVDHWRFRDAERATVPARYTLEVADGRLVGDFAATVTPGDVLDYQTSEYFGIRGWREHPLFLRPRLGRVERVPGTVLSLTARGTSINYYHFLYDAIARYGVFEEAMPGEPVDAIVVPHRAGYQRGLLELAGIGGRLIEPMPGQVVLADRLLVPSTPNQALDAPPWIVAWLRARLPASEEAETGLRLYLTRGDKPNTRRYVQEPELWPWLQDQGFLRVDAGTYSVREQIDLFQGADVVIGPHGAALTNVTFCRPGTRVLELFADRYVQLGLWAIADAVGADYRYLVADGDHSPGRPMLNNYDDVDIPAARVRAAVEAMIG